MPQAGYYHTLALSDTGRVWAFGSNAVGQLGLGEDVEASAEPRLIKALEGELVVAIAAGMEHSLALTAAGEVYSWGCGTDGRLGHGRPASMRLWGSRNELRPRLIRGLETFRITGVAAGQMHSAAVASDGRLLAWGSGRFHQLGLGAAEEHASPVEVPGVHAAAAVACGGLHTLAALHSGELLTWGANQNGCLGLGSDSAQQPRRPARVAAPKGLAAEAVAAGWKHSAAVTRGGQLWTWGWGGSQGARRVWHGCGGWHGYAAGAGMGMPQGLAWVWGLAWVCRRGWHGCGGWHGAPLLAVLHGCAMHAVMGLPLPWEAVCFSGEAEHSLDGSCGASCAPGPHEPT